MRRPARRACWWSPTASAATSRSAPPPTRRPSSVGPRRRGGGRGARRRRRDRQPVDRRRRARAAVGRGRGGGRRRLRARSHLQPRRRGRPRPRHARRPLHEHLARWSPSAPAARRAIRGLSGMGAVVGATEPRSWPAARADADSIFLVPGVGAQGGSPASSGRPSRTLRPRCWLPHRARSRAPPTRRPRPPSSATGSGRSRKAPPAERDPRPRRADDTYDSHHHGIAAARCEANELDGAHPRAACSRSWSRRSSLIVIGTLNSDDGSASPPQHHVDHGGCKPAADSRRVKDGYYVVQAGTSGSTTIAEKTCIPVDQLVQLNPNLDPQALQSRTASIW